MTIPLFASSGLPKVTEAAACDDRSWFCERPDRQFRGRADDGGIWLIRRQPPGVLLRVFSRSQPFLADDDGTLAFAWFGAAYHWSIEQTLRRAHKALRPPPLKSDRVKSKSKR
jgi:hypothetical protein